MIKIKLILSVLTTVILVGWGISWAIEQNTASTSSETAVSSQQAQKSRVTLVSSQEFAGLAEDADAFVVDVHTPAQTQIPGTDIFIPFDQIKENKSTLPKDKTTPILVYCRSGSMSAQASEEIAALGYTNVYDLDGGTDAYKEYDNSVQLWPKKQELGTVVYGDVVSTSFTLTNYAPLPLKITRVSTSCGCTQASVAKETLAAYESTQVTVSFDPAVHQDDTDIGELTRSIYIETDNPSYSDLETIITAHVVKKN